MIYWRSDVDDDDVIAAFRSTGIEVRDTVFDNGVSGIVARVPSTGKLIGVGHVGAISVNARRRMMVDLMVDCIKNGFDFLPDSMRPRA